MAGDRRSGEKQSTKKPFTVVFVCTGNSCRSPMAEGILKKKLQEEGVNTIQVLSAGTGGFTGLAASDYAREVSAEQGIDLSQHRSRPVDEDLMQQANLVLVMARDHEEYLRRRFPARADNVFLLKRFGRSRDQVKKEDIEDPIGESKRFYRKIFHEIGDEIERIFPYILQLAEEYGKTEQNREEAEWG